MNEPGFKSAIGWNFGGSIAKVAAAIICQVLLLRLLGPVPAGHFAIFLIIVGIGSILSEGGVAVALMRAPTMDDQLGRNALFVTLCYSVVVAIALLLLADLLMQMFQLAVSERYLPVMAAANVVLMGLTSVPLSMLKRQFRARELQLIQFGAYLAGFLVVAMPLAWVLQSAIVLVVAFTVQTVTVLVAAIWVSRCPILPHWRGASAVQGVSSRALMSNVAFYINESVANIFTAHVLGARAVGLYNTAYNLLRMPADAVISAVHAPLLVASAQDEEGSVTSDRFLSILNMLATTILGVLTVVFLCGEQLVRFLLGEEWRDSAPVLAIIALVIAFRLVGGISGTILWGRGKLIPDFIAQIIGLLVIGGGFWILQPGDVTSVAWIVFAAGVARAAMQLGFAMRTCHITVAQIIRALVAPAAVTVLLMWPMRWIGPALLPDPNILGFVAFGAGAATLLFLRVVLAIAWSPYAWVAPLRNRLPFPRIGRSAMDPCPDTSNDGRALP